MSWESRADWEHHHHHPPEADPGPEVRPLYVIVTCLGAYYTGRSRGITQDLNGEYCASGPCLPRFSEDFAAARVFETRRAAERALRRITTHEGFAAIVGP